MNASRLLLSIVTATLGTGLLSAGEPGVAIELAEARSRALRESPVLEASAASTRAMEGRELDATKIPNPEVDVRLWELGLQRGESDVSRQRVVFSQEVELGRKRRRRVELARAEQQIASSEARLSRAAVVQWSETRFFELLGAQERTASQRRRVERLEQVRGQIADLVEAGLLGSLELPRLNRRLGLAKIDLLEAEADLATARHRLAATWGSDETDFSHAVGELNDRRPLPDLASLLESANAGAASARSDAAIAREEATLALAKSMRIPDLKFGAGVRWETDIDPDYLVDFEISLPLFDRRQGEILEARHQVSRAAAEKRVAATDRRERIAAAFHDLERAHGTCRELESVVLPAARAVVEAYETAFVASTDTLDGLVDAYRDRAAAETDFTNALVDYHRARATLDALIGVGGRADTP